jgi:peptidyl-prolyl cis-trans isomerase D
MKDGSLLVLRVNQHIPAAERPLADVKAKIQSILFQQQSQKAALQLGQSLLDQLQSNDVTPQTMANKNQLVWISLNNVTRMSAAADAQIIQQAFNSAVPAKAPTLSGFTMTNGNYAIVAVNGVTNINAKNISDAQVESVQKTIDSAFTQSTISGYMQAATKSAGVKNYGIAADN